MRIIRRIQNNIINDSLWIHDILFFLDIGNMNRNSYSKLINDTVFNNNFVKLKS